MDPIELQAVRDGDTTRLLSPEVGWFTCAEPKGRILVPGQEVGRIETIGVSRPVVVPEGVRGRVAGERPERIHEPVDVGAVLYELEPVAGEEAAVVAEARAGDAGALVVPSPHTGRFWHRPSPDAPAMAGVGDVLEDGRPIGLIEVMKTFTRVTYQPAGGLPARARVTRVLVDDGGEAVEGEGLFEVEPA